MKVVAFVNDHNRDCIADETGLSEEEAKELIAQIAMQYGDNCIIYVDGAVVTTKWS